MIDMTGKRFGSVVAISQSGVCKSRDLKWTFDCDCGVRFESSGYAVRSGKVSTCPQCSAKRVAESFITHGLSSTAEFSIWTGMQTRCGNKSRPEYMNYGGRGIRVCDRWASSFENFISDMGMRPSNKHSIDRINPDGDYEPKNCRWATSHEQANNKRNNLLVEINGDEKTLTEWCKERKCNYPAVVLRYHQGIRGEKLFEGRRTRLTHNGITDSVSGWSKRTGIKQSTISMRITKYGWPVEKALTIGGVF